MWGRTRCGNMGYMIIRMNNSLFGKLPWMLRLSPLAHHGRRRFPVSFSGRKIGQFLMRTRQSPGCRVRDYIHSLQWTAKHDGTLNTVKTSNTEGGAGLGGGTLFSHVWSQFQTVRRALLTLRFDHLFKHPRIFNVSRLLRFTCCHLTLNIVISSASWGPSTSSVSRGNVLIICF